ncbi:hypothetical protein EMCRGX_G004518 [Ephydatia muelleri]
MDKLRTFAIGDRVWVRDFRPSAEHRWVQGEVTAKIGMMCYQVILSDGHKRKVHVDHLKHHVLSMPVETEIPEGEPTLQPSTSHNPVGTTHLRDEDTNGIIEQQSQHRNQPSTATVREEGRDRIELKVESEEHQAKYRVDLAILCKFIQTVPQPKEKNYFQFAKWIKVTHGEEPNSAEIDTIIAEDVEFQYDTQANMLGDGVQTDIQHPNEDSNFSTFLPGEEELCSES